MQEKDLHHSRDWHSADIIAALKKRGVSLAALSRSHGYSSHSLSNALRTKWPKAEAIIATALDLNPSEIWPSRYIKPFNKQSI